MISSFVKEAIVNLETSNEKIKLVKLEEEDIIADLEQAIAKSVR